MPGLGTTFEFPYLPLYVLVGAPSAGNPVNPDPGAPAARAPAGGEPVVVTAKGANADADTREETDGLTGSTGG